MRLGSYGAQVPYENNTKMSYNKLKVPHTKAPMPLGKGKPYNKARYALW